jgi:GAF domain-containing protein
MAEAARDLQHQSDPQATLDSAVALAVSNVEGCDAAAISFVRKGKHIDTPAATGQLAIDADRLQYETGEGPCLTSIWEQETVYSPSLAYDARWPTWGPLVVEETGARSVLSFQLFTDQDTLGALNLYSRSKDGFDQADRDDGLALAAHIAVAVAGAVQIANLNIALASRTAIATAVGMLMERFELDDDRAFAVLTRVSASHESKVRDVAAAFIATRTLPSGG